MAKRKKQTRKKFDKETEKHLKQLGARLQQLRLKKGFASYEVFAYEHDLNRTQYGAYENGRNIQYDTLLKLVKTFGLTMKEFFSEGFD